MNNLVKYPRTPHLPWSCGRTDDDVYLVDVSDFVGKDVVVTEKLDGENTTMYCDHIHARSLDSRDHESRHWVKKYWSNLKHLIPDGFRIVGENVYAVHSIEYSQLPTYFLVFAIFEGENCLSWEDTIEWCHLLGMSHVPVLYNGIWDEDVIKNCMTGSSKFGGVQEGYVVRNVKLFERGNFVSNVAKFVRKGHVQTDAHWMSQSVRVNKIRCEFEK